MREISAALVKEGQDKRARIHLDAGDAVCNKLRSRYLRTRGGVHPIVVEVHVISTACWPLYLRGALGGYWRKIELETKGRRDKRKKESSRKMRGMSMRMMRLKKRDLINCQTNRNESVT